jgi:PQQ-dependent catabolism-associated CXXCW motif protein
MKCGRAVLGLHFIVWHPRRLLINFLAASLLVAVPAQAAELEFDAVTGYRIARYRSPVPETVPGGTRISAAEIKDLVQKHDAVLIDVMPSDGAGLDTVTGQWRMTKPRQDIPGSVWLPDVGKGELTAAMDSYFRSTIAKLTGGNRARAVILYCQADCWMSWNAVKRAASYGYTALYWFPEGSDGWRDWDGNFVEAVPVAVHVVPGDRPAAEATRP